MYKRQLQFRALPHVRGHGNDFAALVMLLEPGDDDGRVQTAGIGQNDLLILLHQMCIRDRGFGGEVTVTVTLTDGAITAVTAEGAGETEGVGSKASELMPRCV